MLGIEVVCIGKLGQRFYREGCDEYIKRLGAYAKVTVTELPESKPKGNGPAADALVIEEEGARILEYLAKRQGKLVALCVEGRQLESAELAQFLRDTAMTASSIVFVIGGSLGLSQAVKEKAQVQMSMSRMTLPHQLARLVLLEQIYRACSINAGAKYHK